MNARSRIAVLVFLSAACTSPLPRRGTDGATVTIGQPTVYMRERSLIERFEDLEWLRAQRSKEKEKEYEQGFQGSIRTATAEMTGFALKAAIGQVLAEEEDGASPSEPPPDEAAEPAPAEAASSTASDDGSGGGSGDGAGDEPGAVDVFSRIQELDDTALGTAFDQLNKSVPTLSPRDKLVNRIAFRDTVSEAIRQRSLDDVHDLEGNALYELQFDLSIVGGNDPGQAYAVMLEVRRTAAKKDAPPCGSSRRRVVQVLQAACLAELEATDARYVEGWLTTLDSPYVQEAELRGTIAARHAELMAMQRRMVEVERLQGELWELVHARRGTIDRARLEPLRNAPRCGASVLREQWTRFDQDLLTEDAFRDRILAGEVACVSKANGLVAKLLEDCRAHLLALSGRQQGLTDLARELVRLDVRKRLSDSAEMLEELLAPAALPEIPPTPDEVASDRQLLDFCLALERLVPEATGSVIAEPARQLRAKLEGLRGELEILIRDRRSGDIAALIQLLARMQPRDVDSAETLLRDLDARDAGPRTFAIHPPIPSETPMARTEAQEERVQELLEGLGQLELQEGVAREIADLLWRPSQASVRRFTRRALGFVIVRDHAENSGRVFDYGAKVPVNGLDARALLPLLLVDTKARLPALDRCDPRVVAVAPHELAEQTTTSAHSDLASAFSVALDGVFRGTVANAQAAFDRVSKELRRYELIGRNPLLVGFVGGNVKGKSHSNSFGWILGPRLEASVAGTAKLRYRQSSAHHSVSATLIAPATLDQVELHYKVFRIGPSGEWLECRPVPNPREETRKLPYVMGALPAVRCHDNVITVQLPTSPEVIAQALLTRNRWSETKPRVFAARPAKTRDEESESRSERLAIWQLRANEPSAMTILGRNLWRNPQVYAGGQRASRVQIMSDLGGLWAEFDKVAVPPGQNDEPVRVDLIVATSRGSDVVLDAIEVLPPRKQAKPPEPTFGPPVQVAVPVISQDGSRHFARFGMRFDLAPPLPPTWNELRLRARTPSAAAYRFDVPVAAAQVVPDGKKAGSFEIRDVVLERNDAWPKVDVLEVMLQVREKHTDDLRSVHATPVEIALVQKPIDCHRPVAPVLARKHEGKWYVASKTTVSLVAKTPLDAKHAELLLPAMKPGTWVDARVELGGASYAARMSAKEGKNGSEWSVELPESVVLSSADSLPGTATTRAIVGDVEWTVELQLGQ